MTNSNKDERLDEKEVSKMAKEEVSSFDAS